MFLRYQKDQITKSMIRWLFSLISIFLVTSLYSSVNFNKGGNEVKFGTIPFITTWKTDNPGISGPNQITIPTYVSSVYNYAVDWGDGNITTGHTGNATHTYATPGTYTVSITGTFPRIFFGGNIDEQKILTIEQWGDNQWATMHAAFEDCSNLQGNFTDIPDLSNVTDMSRMFTDASSFNYPIGNWDVSTVTNMSALFFGASSFNQDIGSWNVGNVTDMSDMFRVASVFNQNIGSWNVSSVTNLRNMFFDAVVFDQDIGNWNVSNVTNMLELFRNAVAFNQDIGNWDVSNTVNMYGVFLNTTFNHDISSWDVSSATNMGQMFGGTTAFNQNIGGWNVSNVTEMSGMFSDANVFNQDIGVWDVGNVTRMHGMFYRNTVFDQDISNWDVSSVTNMADMFYGTTSFDQNLGTWNVSNVIYMSNMFRNVTLSTSNYDALLIGWNMLALNPNNNFHGGNSMFCAADLPRANIISSYNWNITDGGSAVIIVDDLTDQNAILNYTLPSITGTNLTGNEMYFTGTNGTGTVFAPGSTINYTDFTSYPVTIYIYDQTGTSPNCNDEKDFALTLTSTAPPGPIVSIAGTDEKCDSDTNTITLSAVVTPAASTGTYTYEWFEQGNATVLGTNPTFDVSPATGTTYVVVVTDDGLPAGSNSGNATHTITVVGSPLLDTIMDVMACNSYTLPPITGLNLSGTAMYNDGMAGSGNSYAPGSTLNLSDFTSYPVTLFVYDENNGATVTCPSEISFDLTITPTIIADNLASVTVCDSYSLPFLSLDNTYWSGPGGTGTSFNPGQSISSDTTLYIYADNGGCTDESQFTVTVTAITADILTDATGCVDYILPTLSPFNTYYTGPNKTGTLLNALDPVTNTSTIYVFAELGSGSNVCSDESSFEVTITGQAIADNLDDVVACESYILPTLSPNNRYFDQMGGTGTEYFPDDIITSTLSLYIYAGVPGCSAETDFNISIDSTPVTASEMEDVRVCENYVLPEITNGRYYTQSEGQGTELFAFGVIDTTQQIYIFNVLGSCTAESSFLVTIDCTPPPPTTCVSFPKFFSPNLDGANDFFTAVIDPNCSTNGMLSIYDRYGKLMKQFDPSIDYWDGTYDGQIAPSTDYWYHFVDKVTNAEIRGHFSLKR